jgi:thioredoxin reductase (NADPH)
VLLLEKENFGGQITFSPRLENYPTIMEISGSEFANLLLEQVIAHGAEIELAEATEIKDMGDYKIVCTEYGDFEGKTVIIATGSKEKRLKIEDENIYGIWHCELCDGVMVKDKDVAIIGGGDSAFTCAIYLSNICKKVHILVRGPHPRANNILVEEVNNLSNVFIHYTTSLKAITQEGKNIKSIICQQIGNEITIECQGIYVKIGQEPSIGFEAGIPKDDIGFFDYDTKTPGVFVAGDCVSKDVKQIVTACSDGANAAINAFFFLQNM